MRIIIYPNYKKGENKFKELIQLIQGCKRYPEYSFEFVDDLSNIGEHAGESIMLANYYEDSMDSLELPIILFDRMDSVYVNRKCMRGINKSHVKMICKEYVMTEKKLYRNVYHKYRYHMEKYCKSVGILPEEINSKRKIEISESSLAKIQINSWNLFQYSFINPTMKSIKNSAVPEKDIDIFFVCHPHAELPALFHHRTLGQKTLKNIAKKHNYNISVEPLKKRDYISNLLRSKICIAPYGLGARVALDQMGLLSETIVIKPDMEFVKTEPNIYTSDLMEFVKCDWSDLEKIVVNLMDNYESYRKKAAARKAFVVDNYGEDYYIKKFINMLNKLNNNINEQNVYKLRE